MNKCLKSLICEDVFITNQVRKYMNRQTTKKNQTNRKSVIKQSPHSCLFMNKTMCLWFQTCSYSCSKHTYTAFTKVPTNDLFMFNFSFTLEDTMLVNRLSPKTHMISVKFSTIFLPFSEQIILLFELCHGLIQYMLLDVFNVFLSFIKRIIWEVHPSIFCHPLLFLWHFFPEPVFPLRKIKSLATANHYIMFCLNTEFWLAGRFKVLNAEVVSSQFNHS